VNADPRTDPFKATQAAYAARRHFVDGLAIKDIADELDLSRFKVSRLVDWARATGLVRIEVKTSADTDADLSAELERAFGLRRALAVAGLDGPVESVLDGVAGIAALGVAELAQPGDVLGVSWGRTLEAIVQQLPPFRVARVVQLVGGMATLESAAGGVDLIRRLALHAQAEGFPLVAPLIARNAAGGRSLRHEPSIAETVRLFDDVTIAVAGVGSWSPPSSRLIEALGRRKAAALTRRGVCADLCGIMVASDGTVVSDHEIEAQRVGILPTQLRAIPTVVAVAGGTEKTAAISAVLRSGLVDVLVTDAGAARAVLSEVEVARVGGKSSRTPASLRMRHAR